MDMRLDTWNVRSMYRAGSLRAVTDERKKAVKRVTMLRCGNIVLLTVRFLDVAK
jgi:hypothetical protein